jgi:hypothetical protein
MVNEPRKRQSPEYEGWTLVELHGRKHFIENDQLHLFPEAKPLYEVPDLECDAPKEDM